MTEIEANPQPKPDVLVTMKRIKVLLKKYTVEERKMIVDYLKTQGVLE